MVILNLKKVMDEWGLNEESFSNGSAYADLDNDGDLDIVLIILIVKHFCIETIQKNYK